MYGQICMVWLILQLKYHYIDTTGMNIMWGMFHTNIAGLFSRQVFAYIHT